MTELRMRSNHTNHVLMDVQRLFEGGHYFAELSILCGDYSRAATKRGRLLLEEIRYPLYVGMTRYMVYIIYTE